MSFPEPRRARRARRRRREVVPQFPTARQEREVRRTLDREVDKVVEREPGSARIESPGRQLPAQHRHDLEVDQLGRSELMTTHPRTGKVAVGAVVTQRCCQDAGVNDEHGRLERLGLPP